MFDDCKTVLDVIKAIIQALPAVIIGGGGLYIIVAGLLIIGG